MISTTLRILRENDACKKRYLYLVEKLGGVSVYGRDKPITLKKIFKLNGLDDALWVLGKGAIIPKDRDKTAPARKAHDEARVAARKAYDEAMVAAFLKTIDI